MEKAAFLYEQLLSARTYNAAMMDALRAEAHLEWDALFSELAILEAELDYRILHWAQPKDLA